MTGGGGWDAIERQRARPIAVWKGGPGLRVELTLMLEDRAVPATGPVRDKVRRLERFAGIDKEDPEPPLLRWAANHHRDFNREPANKWVIETEPDWGDPVYDDQARLQRYPVSIVLLQHATSQLKRLRKTAPFKTRTMKKGEDLRAFAKRVLGDARKWKTIQTLNASHPRCPTSASYNVKQDVKLKVPPK